MADHSDSRESDNNNSWVMAGSEGLPVEELRSEETAEAPPEAPPPSQGQPPPAAHGQEVPEAPSQEQEEEEEQPHAKPLASGPGVTLDLPSEETPAAPASEPSPVPSPPQAKDSPAHHAEEGSAAALPGGPVFRRAGPPAAEDVEGLRRRKGREGPEVAAGAAAGGGRAPGAREEGGQAIWLCGLLALLGLGVLVALGVILDNGDGPGDPLTTGPGSDQSDLSAGSKGKDWPATEPPVEAGLRVSQEEGLPPHVGAARDPPSLEAMGALLDKMAKENQDIRLMQAELQAQKEELQALLRKTEGEAQASSGQQQSLAAENARLKEALRRESSSLLAARDEVRLLREAQAGADPVPGPQPKPEPAEAEVRRLRSLLESLGHDLAKAAQGDPPRPELSALREKVSQALGRGPKDSGPPKAKRGKEKRGKEEEGAKKAAAGKKGKRRPPPREPPALWQALATQSFGPPRGCSGVPECARKEGLAPVRQEAFLQAAQGFLSGRGWGRHLAGLAGATQGFFGPDGLFAHDRLRFLEFLDEAEDALEELARALGGSKDQAYDFEETVLRHLGRVTPRSSSSGHGGHHPHGKDRGREGAGRRNGRENASRAFGHH